MEKFSLDLSCTRMTPQGLEYRTVVILSFLSKHSLYPNIHYKLYSPLPDKAFLIIICINTIFIASKAAVQTGGRVYAPRKVILNNFNLFDLILEIFVSDVALMLSYDPFLFSHFLLFFSSSLYCSSPFPRKADGHSFRLSVLLSFRPSVRPPIVCTLCAQLLLQFYSDSFKTLQMS